MFTIWGSLVQRTKFISLMAANPKMSNILKLENSEPFLPGLALPDAFRALDSRLESTLQQCSLKETVDAPLLSLVTVCQEMQTLLKLAFIENGLLASRIEVLTRYQTEAVKNTDKKVTQVETSHKATKKQIKKLRKRLSVYETIQRKKTQKWWDVKVKATDYDTFSYLARGSGCPDLEFMLRINQILIDFVNDDDRQELFLPPMGNEERAELSKLASIYKLRCRYGKSTQLATSTLIKARQTTIPHAGEVDAVLDTFARTHKNVETEEVSAEETVKDMDAALPQAPGSKQKPSSPRIEIPSTMLTPISSLTSPTVDIGISLGQSPPTSGLTTPTAEAPPPTKSVPEASKKPKEPPESTIPPPKKTEPVKPIILRDPRLTASAAQSALQLQQLQLAQIAGTGRPLNLPGAQVPGGALTGKSLLSGSGGLLQLAQSQLRQPTVMASPIKVPANLEGKNDTDSVKREKEPAPSPPKRIRLTRKSAGGNTEQEQ